MQARLHVELVIIGHSERRRYVAESDELVAAKLRSNARGSPYFSSLLLGKMRATSPAAALTASSGAIPATSTTNVVEALSPLKLTNWFAERCTASRKPRDASSNPTSLGFV